MVGSMDSLDFCTETPITEKNAIPVDCWQDVSLSNIWIPSHLLSSRSKPRNTKVTQGIYHTLEKKDSSKYAQSFSVYSYSDIENEQGEIFVSDSDEDIFRSGSTSLQNIDKSDNTLPTVTDLLCSRGNGYSNNLGNSTKSTILNKNSERRSNGNLNAKENLIISGEISSFSDKMYEVEKVRKVINSEENLLNNRKYLEKDERVHVENPFINNNTGSQINFNAFKDSHTMKKQDFEDGVAQASRKVNKDTNSIILLKDILDDTSEVNIKEFSFDFKKKDDSTLLCAYDRKEKIRTIKKDKVKKKPTKHITLDKFFVTNVDASQDYYCDKYFQTILNEKNKNDCFHNVLARNNAEFPAPEEYKFIHSDKTIKDEDAKMNFSSSKCSLDESEEISKNEEIVDLDKIKSSMTDTKYGKIIISNIPFDVTKDDLLLLLCGYGEIKNLSLVSAGNFLTASVEIDLICDIDWIIECLNGSEPFGAATEKLQCYKQ